MNDSSQRQQWQSGGDGQWFLPARSSGGGDHAAASPPSAQLLAFRGLEPGWYRDFDDPALARYWDGANLGEERRRVLPADRGSSSTEPRGRQDPDPPVGQGPPGLWLTPLDEAGRPEPRSLPNVDGLEDKGSLGLNGSLPRDNGSRSDGETRTQQVKQSVAGDSSDVRAELVSMKESYSSAQRAASEASESLRMTTDVLESVISKIHDITVAVAASRGGPQDSRLGPPQSPSIDLAAPYVSIRRNWALSVEPSSPSMPGDVEEPEPYGDALSLLQAAPDA